MGDVLPFVPSLNNAELDEEIIERERAYQLEKIANVELRVLDIDRVIDGLVSSDEKL